MCESMTVGGRLCVAHTRPPYLGSLHRVEHAVGDEKNKARALGVAIVSAHASTRTGAQEIHALIQAATESGDHDQAAWLTTCHRLGESHRQVVNDLRRAVQTLRPT